MAHIVAELGAFFANFTSFRHQTLLQKPLYLGTVDANITPLRGQVKLVYSMILKKEIPIQQIITTYPETRKFFNDMNMSCSGCFAVGFDTLEHGALMHGIRVDTLINRLDRFLRSRSAAEGAELGKSS